MAFGCFIDVATCKFLSVSAIGPYLTFKSVFEQSRQAWAIVRFEKLLKLLYSIFRLVIWQFWLARR